MSLLMDALKKAEQDKKEAARRQKEIEGLNQEETGATVSKAMDDTDTWGHEIVDASTTAELPELGRTDRFSTTAELELEPMPNLDNTAEIPSVESMRAFSLESEDPTLNVTINELALAELSGEGLDVDDKDVPDQAPPSIEELQTDDADLLDETFHGEPLDTIDVNPELFQETVRGDAFLPEDVGSSTWGETLPGIPAAQLTEDIGSEDQPTPVAAQTVFTATGTTQASGKGLKWVGAGVVSVLLISLAVYYLTTITPENRPAFSPQIASGVENMGPPLRETLEISIAPDTEYLSGETGAPSADNLTGTLVSEEADLETTLDPESSVTIASELTPASSDSLDAISDEPGIVAAISGTAETIGQLPDRILPGRDLIKISRSRSPDNKGKAIKEAYAAYQNGGYELAVSKYKEALKEFPDNRDAMLGLAAIASNDGDYKSAYKLYLRVLSNYPRDEFARAALISLQDTSVLVGSESMINSMLHDSPDTHFLHFTLGNIYAAGNRWSEAQQAFFDAYRLNSSNADYALNLAISLDHIGQYGAALDYYNVALELSDKSSSRFDPSPVIKRIDDLNRVAED